MIPQNCKKKQVNPLKFDTVSFKAAISTSIAQGGITPVSGVMECSGDCLVELRNWRLSPEVAIMLQEIHSFTHLY